MIVLQWHHSFASGMSLLEEFSVQDTPDLISTMVTQVCWDDGFDGFLHHAICIGSALVIRVLCKLSHLDLP